MPSYISHSLGALTRRKGKRQANRIRLGHPGWAVRLGQTAVHTVDKVRQQVAD